MRVLWMATMAAAMCAVASADSLFTEAVAKEGPLISNEQNRFQVGDIITVQVQEIVTAQTQAGTDTDKKSKLLGTGPVDTNQFLGNFIPDKYLPNYDVKVENKHESDGTTNRSNRLTLVVSCVVKEVLPNGNLHIEGTKKVTINREDTNLLLTGDVRALDVSPANTVTSNQVANVVLTLQGHGPLWNSQRRGLFTRLLDWISPF